MLIAPTMHTNDCGKSKGITISNCTKTHILCFIGSLLAAYVVLLIFIYVSKVGTPCMNAPFSNTLLQIHTAVHIHTWMLSS